MMRQDTLVKNAYFWIGWRSEVEIHIKQCINCIQRQGPHRKQRPDLTKYISSEPMQRIAMDTIGPLPKTDKGNSYILIISDYFTKWVEAFPLPDVKAETLTETLVTHFISRFGCPLEIHTDQGRNFDGKVFGYCVKDWVLKKQEHHPTDHSRMAW